MHISRSATFGPDDASARILEDLVCPACGRLDPGDAHTRIIDNNIRVYCDGCGAFITVSLTDEQARAVRRS